MSEPMDHGWLERLLGGTGGRIVTQLRQGERTVAELSEELGLTANAVRVKLVQLERDGLVEQAGRREGVRKPHLLYRLAPRADRLLPKAYVPVLHQLLSVLAQRQSPEELERLLEEVGNRLATEHPAAGDLQQRLDQAMTLLGQLGGVAELERDEQGRPVIEGQSCPLGEVVREHPGLCRMMEVLLSRILEAPVRECCQRSDRPACRFVVDHAAE